MYVGVGYHPKDFVLFLGRGGKPCGYLVVVVMFLKSLALNNQPGVIFSDWENMETLAVRVVASDKLDSHSAQRLHPRMGRKCGDTQGDADVCFLKRTSPRSPPW